MRRRFAMMLVVAALVGGCTSDPGPVSPPPVASASADTPPGATATETASTLLTPTPAASVLDPRPTTPPSAGPTLSPTAPAESTATLPIAGTRFAVEGAALAAGSEGVLFATIARRSGALLVALGPDGRAMPHWPIELPRTTHCHAPIPMPDGSVRISCDGTDLPVYDLSPSDVRIYAFGLDARPLPGWPVEVPAHGDERAIGTDLVLVSDYASSDTTAPGKPSHESWITRVAGDGTVTTGARAAFAENCCGQWSLGPDGAAYASRIDGLDDGVADGTERTVVTALDEAGLRGGGWPASIAGAGSAVAFDSDGHLLVSLGSYTGPGVRVRALGAGDATRRAISPRLSFPALELGDDCVVADPERPVAAPDGSTYVDSQLGDRIYALDGSLEPRAGWPYVIPGPRVYPGISDGGLDCFAPAAPVASPEGGMYLLLARRTAHVGGRIVLVGLDGRVRKGWPVELRRPDAAFWQVTASEEGVAYALVIEPETANRWSGTVLAIAADGSIRYRTVLFDA